MASLYKPLCAETGEIRLIVVNPGNSPDPISCSFDIVSLTDAPIPAYDALCYTWGDDEIGRQPTFVDGQLLHVRLNLHAALQTIRTITGAAVLWIDALCINQSDLGERARQVRITRDIFARARRVLAWVGPLHDERDLHAMHLMTRIILEPERWASEATRGLIGIDNLHENPLSSLYHFLSRPYWGRMWIVQELAVAQECWVLWKAADLAGTLTFTQMIDAVCHFRENDCKIDLRGALEFLPGHSCSDPRDKVYAILGLCGEATRTAIVPDYSEAMTLVKLHRRVVEHCLDVEGNLTVLAGPRHHVAQDDGLPSWCPRFHDIDQWLAKDPLDLRGLGLAHSPSLRFIDHAETGPMRLIVEGYVVDRIATIVDISDPDITLESPTPLPLLEEIISSTLQKVANSTRKPNAKLDRGGPLKEAAMTTLEWLLSSEESPLTSESFQNVASTRLRRDRIFLTELNLVGVGPIVFDQDDLLSWFLTFWTLDEQTANNITYRLA
ncbi:uncharacterized protein PgNI_02011 [Pyricularia grisea]|uniref:Heterokaryon incompatibility domain-containing protein n=1 Tax=Pyricularia grisea TaxID=148305 RepID=A0A6P8BKA3_PYRGI|nr:uncharacterized protein PgNI_02011 [Pyricularia grisea]TLD17124.1 hypothetical protein PgNI_02011 [Pyricularia grisea]